MINNFLANHFVKVETDALTFQRPLVYFVQEVIRNLAIRILDLLDSAKKQFIFTGTNYSMKFHQLLAACRKNCKNIYTQLKPHYTFIPFY